MNQTIAISGKSCVTSLGEGVEVWIDAILNGEAIEPVINPDMFQTEINALQKGPYEMYRVQKITAITLLKALEDARVKITESNAERVSILFGSSYEIEGFKSDFFKTYRKSEPGLTSPSIFPYTSSSVIVSALSILFGIRGTNITFSNGITSASEAIIAGRDLLFSRKTDVVIVIGTNFFCDDFDSELHNCGFRQECCAAIVLERTEEAESTGKHVYAKIEQLHHGFGANNRRGDWKGCFITNRGNSFGRSFVKKEVRVKPWESVNSCVDLNSVFGNTFSASGVLGIILGSLFLAGSTVLEECYNNIESSEILFINEDNYGNHTSVVIKK